MKSLNRVALMGNLAADPDVKKTQEGVTVVGMSVATDRAWVDKEGEQQKKTEFHKISVWRKLGELCEKYLKKGSPVYLEGYLANKSYTNTKGDKKYYTEIVATDIHLLKFMPAS
ncbi:single-stranded DNA-binding protein [Patescibacteria group bacterium]|nr:single-stranded DNA-binding protein [Patescibacteria group bacterium]